MIDNEKLICWCKGFIPSYHRSPESKIPIWHPVINCSQNISKADRKRKRERLIASIWKSQLKFKSLGMIGEWREIWFLLQSWKCWWKSYHPGAFPSLKVARNFLIAAFWPQLNPLENDFVTFQSCPPRGGWWNWTKCSPSVEKLQIKICRREESQRPSHFGISPR